MSCRLCGKWHELNSSRKDEDGRYVCGSCSSGSILPPVDDGRWRLDAACIEDPAVFEEAAEGNGRAARMAIAVCRTCPVIDKCWAFVQATESGRASARHGIWAATTPSQRAQMQRDSRKAVA